MDKQEGDKTVIQYEDGCVWILTKVNVPTANVVNLNIDVLFAINTGMALLVAVKQPKMVTCMEEELVKTKETMKGTTVGISMKKNMANKIISMSTNKVELMFDLYYRGMRQQQPRGGASSGGT